MAILELKEILWEITNRCSKCCEYCGSKDILNKNYENEEKIINFVLDKIIDFKKEYVNDLAVVLTGGEPSEIGEKRLLKVLTMLKEQGIKTKVLTNGNLFDLMAAEEKLAKYIDVIGVSVNTIGDIQWLNNVANFREHIDAYKNITVITNFGKHNVFDFDQIKEFVEANNTIWQIQLTMGECQLNKSGIDFLMDKVKEAQKDYNIVLADNMNCGKCAAGIKSIGITYRGDVIGCLAERSFCPKMPYSYGNLKSRTLVDIWENEFKDIRFCDSRSCCKDYIDYDFSKKIEYEISKTITKNNRTAFIPANPTKPPIVLLYGVAEQQTYIYGVVGQNDFPTIDIYGAANE